MVGPRRADKADRQFETLVKDTDFEWLDGYPALRRSFLSILVAQGMTWDQIAAFVGHLDQRTTQRHIHFVPKDKWETPIRSRLGSATVGNVRKQFDIRKLRMLLYSSNLTPENKKAIQRDDKGVVWLCRE